MWEPWKWMMMSSRCPSVQLGSTLLLLSWIAQSRLYSYTLYGHGFELKKNNTKHFLVRNFMWLGIWNLFLWLMYFKHLDRVWYEINVQSAYMIRNLLIRVACISSVALALIPKLWSLSAASYVKHSTFHGFHDVPVGILWTCSDTKTI